MRESRRHADPPLTTTYRRRLSPRTAGKAVHSGLDLSWASRRLPGFHLRQWGRQVAAAWSFPSKIAPSDAVPVAALRARLALALGPLVSALLPLLASSPRLSSLVRRASRLTFSPRRTWRPASWPQRASPAPCGPRSYARRSFYGLGPSSWRWSFLLPPVRRSHGGWSCVHSFSCLSCVSFHSFS